MGGLRLLDLRMIHPIEPGIIDAFAAGLTEIIVVEEKRSFIEAAIRDMLYGRPNAPLVTGKRYPDGTSAFPASGELEPDTIAPVLAARLRSYPGFETVKSWELARRPRRDRRLLPLAVRTPYFCSGCPHNTSAKTPDGALVGAGIGCHGLVLGMSAERVGEVTGLTQMGGEGAQWIGMAPFLDRPHLYQNLGDGTFHHSGSLAIRAAVAGGVNITYKLLYNSAVAMTGGQQAQGAMTIPEITRSLTAEGVSKIIVTTDSPKSYRRAGLAPGTRVYGRDRIVEAQEELAATPGVTVLIHDQECATELRRKRKRGLAADPAARVMINERVCEGCGDCGRKSNCLSVHPVDTEFGRKTRIDQSSCNKDYSCLDGDCPAFLTVVPGKRTRHRRDVVALGDLPEPPEAPIAGHHTTRVLGIGGSGVVTLSQILAAAANLAGRQAVSLDQTGLAQKGGAVISDVKIGTDAESMASKAASQEVDLYLGADLLVAADPRNLTSTDPGRTVAVVSTSQVPTGRMAVDVTTRYPDTAALMDDIREATDAGSAVFLDVRAASSQLFGDDQFANLILTGIAYQLGALPLPAGSIEQAIETNGVRVEENTQAFRRGRQYVANRGAFEAAVSPPSEPTLPAERPEIEELVRRTGVDASSLLGLAVRRRVGELLAYQDHRYAAKFADIIARVHRAESESVPGSTALTGAVVQNLHKLMAYKDEYEVARLSLLPELEADIRAQFGDGATFVYRLHPPTLRAMGMKKKISLGPWFRFVYRALVGMRRLRGTSFDPFGRAEVRRVERALVGEYIDLINAVLKRLSRETIELAVQIAEAPDVIRGYEHVKLANVDRFRSTIAVLLESYESRAGLMAREGRG